MFHTGVKLLSVDDKAVSDSIVHDKDSNITWSIVLESVFESFKEFVKNQNK